MWIHVLEEEKQSYFFKYRAFNETYDFFLTNFVHLWELRLSKNDLAALVQENNHIIVETDNTSLTKSFLEMLNESLSKKITESSVDVSQSGECIILKIKFFKGASFKIVFKLNTSSPLLFFQEVTMPLITGLKELKESEKNLVESLQKKDLEIEDYKSTGAQLSYKHLETITFNAEEHKKIYTPSSDCFLKAVDVSSILNSFKEKENALNASVAQGSKDNLLETFIKSEDSTKRDVKLDCDGLKREFDNNHVSGTFPLVKTENEPLYSESIYQTTQGKRKRKKQLNL